VQFVRDGDLFKVVSITGPSHNFLGLSFGGQDGAPIDMDIMDIKPDEPKQLLASDVEAQVCEGIDIANKSFGTPYRVSSFRQTRPWWRPTGRW